MKLNEVFECPACKESLSVSDSYQNAMRFTEALGFCSLIFCTILILHLWFPERLLYWLTYPVSYGAATSLFFLYRRTFTRLFPPRLQRGTPYFVTLDLKGRQSKASSEKEQDKA